MFSFERKESSFLQITFIVAGALIIFFGLVSPAYVPLKFLLVVFGLAFFGAAFYLPQIGRRFSPERITFDRDAQEVTIEMADGNCYRLPFAQIDDFEIGVEKRSPSAANSAGIHYLHHHINFYRLNGATFNITSTTDKEEANQILRLLKALKVDVPLVSSPPPELPQKIQIKHLETKELRWQADRYGLSIGNQLIYTEYKSDGSVESSKEFPIVNVSHAIYSYASTIQNRNFSVYIHFHKQEPAKLGLFVKDLNPVECLQFENWLNNELLERKKALV